MNSPGENGGYHRWIVWGYIPLKSLPYPNSTLSRLHPQNLQIFLNPDLVTLTILTEFFHWCSHSFFKQNSWIVATGQLGNCNFNYHWELIMIPLLQIMVWIQNMIFWISRAYACRTSFCFLYFPAGAQTALPVMFSRPPRTGSGHREWWHSE